MLPYRKNKPDLHPEDSGDSSVDSGGNLDPALDVAGDADDRLREIEMQNRLDAQRAEIDVLKAELEAIRSSVKTEDPSASPTDDIYSDDPAIKKLESIEKRLESKLETLTNSMHAITEEVEKTKETKSRQIVETHAQKWVDGIIQRDPNLSKNEYGANLLKRQISNWCQETFNPKNHLETQFQVLRKAVQNWLKDYGPMVAAGAAKAANKDASTGKPDTRSDALERDQHARDSIASEGTSPPSITEEKVLEGAGDFYNAYMQEYEARTSS